MFDLITYVDGMLGSTSHSFKEILYEFKCEYHIKVQELPSTDAVNELVSLIPARDELSISIESSIDSVFVGGDASWIDEYNRFINGNDAREEITVLIKVKKNIVGGHISIYNFGAFSSFLCEMEPERVLEVFSDLFIKCGEHILFKLLDKKGSITTNSIAVSDNDIKWVNHQNRIELLKDCEDASVFLDRNRLRLVPQDFDIISIEGDPCLATIEKLFEKMKSILAFIYLANTATVSKGKAVLQFDPAAQGYEYDLHRLSDNEVVVQIFKWVFKDGLCVDKASIARKIINTYCRGKDSILMIDENVLNSIKSDYVIYQKNHADQYIEMKKGISQFIVNSTEKVINLSHDITDAFRNNFVAFIVFFMTVFLTDSIDPSTFLETEISSKTTIVFGLFSFATVAYFFTTIIMVNQRWKWLKQSYDDMKQNYYGMFDSLDLEEAFNHDEPLNHVEREYKEIRNKIAIIWSVLIIVLFICTCVLILQGQ